MALTLQIIRKPDNILLENDTKKFAEEGGSIGRAEHCDLCLADDNNTISKIHALIHFRDNMYFITDVSTNGVFINTETVPIGKGNTKQILEGEKLRFGDYIIQATFLDKAARVNVANDTSNYDEDIESLLNDSDDISDLLDVEVNVQQTNKASIVSGDEISVDDILADLNPRPTDAYAGLVADTDNDSAIADLLGTHDDLSAPASIDVMAPLHDSAANERIFENLLMQLDTFAVSHVGAERTVAEIKQHLLDQKDQIIGSN